LGALLSPTGLNSISKFATVSGMNTTSMGAEPRRLSAFQVLFCGALIVTLSMGIRHGFGLWLQPITQAQGWTRETFALALAIQNLSWGVLGVFAGMAADRWGAFKVLVVGAGLYALGLVGMALSVNSLSFALTTGVLIGDRKSVV
jgi:sugar phosphate permease